MAKSGLNMDQIRPKTQAKSDQKYGPTQAKNTDQVSTNTRIKKFK